MLHTIVQVAGPLLSRVAWALLKLLVRFITNAYTRGRWNWRTWKWRTCFKWLN